MSEHQEQLNEIRAAHMFHLRGIAILVFVIYWAIIFTYTDFFWFQPWESSEFVRQVSLWLCLTGWIIASIGTPVVLFAVASGSVKALNLVPITALWWPVSVLISQIVVFTETGESYLGYLFIYPIFLLTDIAIPIFLLVQWSRVKEYLIVHEDEKTPG